jgi:hypothetical protein
MSSYWHPNTKRFESFPPDTGRPRSVNFSRQLDTAKTSRIGRLGSHVERYDEASDSPVIISRDAIAAERGLPGIHFTRPVPQEIYRAEDAKVRDAQLARLDHAADRQFGTPVPVKPSKRITFAGYSQQQLAAKLRADLSYRLLHRKQRGHGSA